MHLCTIFIPYPSQLDINFNIKTDLSLLLLCNYHNIIFVKLPSQFLDKQMGVITTQVVKYNRDVICY